MRLFFYGTLMDPDVRRVVFGPASVGLTIKSARMLGFRRLRARDGNCPLLVRRTAAHTKGELIEGLGPGNLGALFHFEVPDYRPARHLVIGADGHRRMAWVLLPTDPKQASRQAWDFRRWQLRHKSRMMPQLRSWMREFERLEDRSVDIAWSVRRQLKSWRDSGEPLA